MRVFKNYEIDPDEQRQAIADYLKKKLNKDIDPKKIFKGDGNDLDFFMLYKETEILE